jgi:peptidoglycan/LPS O-acetylase OafA/YrhL
MLKEQEEHGKFVVRNFYLRRILRIWPAYFIVLLIGFVIFPILRNNILNQPYLETANPVYYLFFLSNFDQINQHTLPFGVGLGPTWSVSIEEQFYLFWPILLLFFKKSKFIIAILLTLSASLIMSPLFNLSNKHTLYCMLYLSIGGLYGYLSFYKFGFIKKATKIPSLLFIFCVIVLLLCMFISSNGYSSFGLIVFIAFIIGYIIIYQCFSGKMSFNKIPFIESLGKYTYGLYLYHVICNFIAHVLIDDIAKIPESNLMVLIFKPLLSLGFSLILSYISYHYFESFFLKLKRLFSS